MLILVNFRGDYAIRDPLVVWIAQFIDLVWRIRSLDFLQRRHCMKSNPKNFFKRIELFNFLEVKNEI
jgi:hypothetical protein